MTKAQAEQAKLDFVERLALCAEEDGMPRIAGRMIAFLMVHEGACSLDDLAEALQASKASVSTNARFLEERGILVRTSSPGDRRDFYEIAPSPWENSIISAQRKVQRFRDVIQEALTTMPISEKVARRRMREAVLFYDFLINSLRDNHQKWPTVLREAEEQGLLDEPSSNKSRGTR